MERRYTFRRAGKVHSIQLKSLPAVNIKDSFKCRRSRKYNENIIYSILYSLDVTIQLSILQSRVTIVVSKFALDLALARQYNAIKSAAILIFSCRF